MAYRAVIITGPAFPDHDVKPLYYGPRFAHSGLQWARLTNRLPERTWK